MSDETREKYLKAVNIICEQFGLEKPSQIIYVCEAVDRLVEEYRTENEELKEIASRASYRIAELKHEIDELKSELSDIKTAIRNYSKAETYQQQEITWNSLLEFIN